MSAPESPVSGRTLTRLHGNAARPAETPSGPRNGQEEATWFATLRRTPPKPATRRATLRTRAAAETLCGCAGLGLLWPGLLMPSWWLAGAGMTSLITWAVMYINDAGRTP
jgi:hypothetical protein